MIIPSGFAQVTVNYGGNGLQFPGAVVFGIDQGGGADPDDVAETIHASWVASIMTQTNISVRLESVDVKFGPNTTGPSGLFVGVENGGRTGDGSPSNLAVLVRKNTALGGRRGRGRMYLPGVTEADVGSDGEIDSIAQAAWQSVCTSLGNLLVLGGLPMVLLHSDATTPTPVTTLAVQAVAATQRRRMRR